MALATVHPVAYAHDGFVTVGPEHFHPTTLAPGHTRLVAQVESAELFVEAVPSWAANVPTGSRMEVYLKPDGAKASRYCLGIWTADNTRTSVKDQSDDVASVDTDTFTLKSPGNKLTVEIDLYEKATIDSFRLVLSGQSAPTRREPNKAVWGTTLEPPRRAQMTYPNGSGACSPTSVSMLLGYWSSQLKAPQLDHDVPEVQKGVYDIAWKGTGNWPFNMAFAAGQPGMTAYVSRFRDVRDLEDWIAAGVPVATSVSYGLLKGKQTRDSNDGHLVVVVGFDDNGDLVFNDPGRNVVRMTYKRADFERAWAVSVHTVYLVYPKLWRVPTGPGPWEHRQH